MNTRKPIWLAVSICAVLMLGAGRASAQERSGWWFAAGGGWGSADLTCDGCGSSGDKRESSGAGYLGVGYTLNPHVLIGAEGNIWSKTFVDPDFEGNAAINFYNVLGTVTFYPSATGGFFVKGGAGAAFMNEEVKATGVTATIDMGKGFAAMGGAGFDIPIGRIAITPGVSYWYGNTGDLKVMGQTVLTGVKHNVFTATIGIKVP